MARTRRYVYCYNQDESNGYDKCNILISHYGDSSFRTILLRKEEFEELHAWKMTSLLNDAYEAGYQHAMEDLRRFIGVKE